MTSETSKLGLTNSPTSADFKPTEAVPDKLKVGELLQVRVVSYHAFGFVVEALSRKLPACWEKKPILLRPELLQTHFSEADYSKLIHNQDTLEVSIASLPSEKQKQIFVDLSEKTVSLLREKMQKISESNLSNVAK